MKYFSPHKDRIQEAREYTSICHSPKKDQITAGALFYLKEFIAESTVIAETKHKRKVTQ